tara:strand:- start:2040 stop:2486 length:447 start_codon:yes stop_codon:yes gene_type:complete
MNTASLNPATVRRELLPLVKDLLALRAVAEVQRDNVDSIKKRLLREIVCLNDKGERITDPKWDWRMVDGPEQLRYYAELDRESRARFGPDLEEGYCPALVAEHAQLKQEWVLLQKAGDLLDFDWERANRSLDLRKQMLDTLCGLALAA